MGKTKIKPIEESKLAGGADQEMAQPSATKVTGAVEHKDKPETEQEVGARQTRSEPTGRASGTLSTGKPTPKQRSKKYLAAQELIDRSKLYPLIEAVELAQKGSYSKFPGTVELHINTNLKSLRGLITLPFASGKKLTILAFGVGAKAAGADIEGDEELLKDITIGKGLNFDIIVTTPEWMPKLALAAKVLGPRGLMPSPKNGTITDDLGKTISELQAGKIEYKTEANGTVIHLAVGKVDQESSQIRDNVKVLFNILGKSKVQNISLSSTMGPGVKVDLNSI